MTKRRLAEQAQRILGQQVPIQELMLAVNQAFAYVVKNNWWTNKREGENDVNGNFIYAFDDNSILLDSLKNLYYCTLPSTYLGNIPHEMGIPHVSYMESYDKPFIRMSNGMPALFRGLDSGLFDSNDTFFVENNRIYLPTIKPETATKNILIKLVVALDGISEETQISIPPDIEYDIIRLTIQLYQTEIVNEQSKG